MAYFIEWVETGDEKLSERSVAEAFAVLDAWLAQRASSASDAQQS